jgi:hypothetical protein
MVSGALTFDQIAARSPWLRSAVGHLAQEGTIPPEIVGAIFADVQARNARTLNQSASPEVYTDWAKQLSASSQPADQRRAESVRQHAARLRRQRICLAVTLGIPLKDLSAVLGHSAALKESGHQQLIAWRNAGLTERQLTDDLSIFLEKRGDAVSLLVQVLDGDTDPQRATALRVMLATKPPQTTEAWHGWRKEIEKYLAQRTGDIHGAVLKVIQEGLQLKVPIEPADWVRHWVANSPPFPRNWNDGDIQRRVDGLVNVGMNQIMVLFQMIDAGEANRNPEHVRRKVEKDIHSGFEMIARDIEGGLLNEGHFRLLLSMAGADNAMAVPQFRPVFDGALALMLCLAPSHAESVIHWLKTAEEMAAKTVRANLEHQIVPGFRQLGTRQWLGAGYPKTRHFICQNLRQVAVTFESLSPAVQAKIPGWSGVQAPGQLASYAWMRELAQSLI